MSDLRTYLRDIDDHELVVTALEAYLCIWAECLEKTMLRRAVAREIREVIRDLADRKKRLRDQDFLCVARRSDRTEAELKDYEEGKRTLGPIFIHRDNPGGVPPRRTR